MNDQLFLSVLNMSISGGYAILFVILARFCLKKAPRIYSYALWSAAFLRLICPYSFTGYFSLMAVRPETVPHDIMYAQSPQIRSGIQVLDRTISASLPPATPMTSANPLQIWIALGEAVWLIGLAVLLLYSVYTAVRLSGKLREAVPLTDGIWQCEGLETAFVFGVFRPMIYLPAGLSEEEQVCILAHEGEHVRRLDHLIKPMAFLTVCVHWFNPLVWAAFYLMGEDMEMSCDESVIRRLGVDAKKGYSSSLLSLSAGRSGFPRGCPLAFGENNPRKRIRNILNYKKPSRFTAVVCFAVVALIVVGLATDSVSARGPLSGLTGGADQRGLPDQVIQAEAAGGNEEPISVKEELDGLFLALGEGKAVDKAASNPEVYIEANSEAFQKILSYGDRALYYCFSRFEEGGRTDLSGALMAEVCRALSGDEGASMSAGSGQQWYEAFKENARNALEVKGADEVEKHMPVSWLLLQMQNGTVPDMDSEILPGDFTYAGEDEILGLVYDAVSDLQAGFRAEGGFLVPAVRIHESSDEGNKRKVFVTIYDEYYRLFGSQVISVGGSIVPAALTFDRGEDGNYALETCERAEDGSYFAPSIEKYCVTPVSGKVIPGLAKQIVDRYGDDELREQQMENLRQHLLRCGLTGISLVRGDETVAVPLT